MSATTNRIEDSYLVSFPLRRDWFAVVLAIAVLAIGTSHASAQFMEQQKLTAFDASVDSLFGQSVSINGATAIVGAPHESCRDGENCGAAYVYYFDGVSWVEQQKLVPSDAAALLVFGYSVSVSGDWAVVGAPGAICENGRACGAVYVFRFDGTSWVETQKVTVPSDVIFGSFGESVSLSGDRFVAGADNFCGPPCIQSGPAFVFRFDGNAWIEEQRLIVEEPPSVSFSSPTVTISDGVVAVANTIPDGRAFVFRFNGTTWIEDQVLVSSDVSRGDGFGGAITVAGDVAVVGAPRKDCTAGDECGAAYVFRYDGASWQEEQRLTASDGAAYVRFGQSVAVDGDTVVVVAPDKNCPGDAHCRAAYVFQFNGVAWTQTRTLEASDRIGNVRFGTSVAIDGDLTLIGDTGATGTECREASACGAAYVFGLAMTDCGDCVVSPGEVCDGGFGCVECLCDAGWEPTIPRSTKCEPSCGDGNIDPGEECDGGLGCAECVCSPDFEPRVPPSIDCLAQSDCDSAQQLAVSDPLPRDQLGNAISVDGNRVLVAASQKLCDVGFECGAAYLFRKVGSSWVEEKEFVAFEQQERARFGYAVALSGDTVIIGAPFESSAEGTLTGTAYVFQFDGLAWVELQRLTSDAADARDRFGASVSVSGDVAVVGAPSDDCEADDDCGRAYVFRFDGATWVLEQKLAAVEGHERGGFGASVDLRGRTVVVGASSPVDLGGGTSEAAYVFRFDGSSWVEQQKLTASGPLRTIGFGQSVSLSRDTILVGAPGEKCARGYSCGSAFVFRFDGMSWGQGQRLTASDAHDREVFGWSVSVDRNTAVVGAPLARCPGGVPCGGVFVYRYNGTSWIAAQALHAPGDPEATSFGRAVDFSDSTIFAGADEDDGVFGFLGGAAYTFSCDPGPVLKLDIRPGSCPNLVNPKSRGVVPMAIVGTLDFDVSTIEPSSLSLSRADGIGDDLLPDSTRRGPRMVISDVATPFDGESCGCHESRGDGIDDLSIKFSAHKMARAFELNDLPDTETISLVLRGALDDGTVFEASDCITVRGKRRIAGQPIRIGPSR